MLAAKIERPFAERVTSEFPTLESTARLSRQMMPAGAVLDVPPGEASNVCLRAHAIKRVVNNGAILAAGVGRQLELFAASSKSAIVGLVAPADRPSPHCGRIEAVVGSSGGPHFASLTCAGCQRHLGWLPGWRYRALTREAQVVEG
jgi:hypothetical protein